MTFHAEMHFHEQTPQQVREVLEQVFRTSEPVRIFYGDRINGRVWPEEHHVTGKVGRSTGKQKVPILLANRTAASGPAILDHCIVGVMNRYKRFYCRHPDFRLGNWELGLNSKWWVYKDGQKFASFDNHAKAQRYIDFMTGKRFRR